jgi:predicted Zn-dependent protease
MLIYIFREYCHSLLLNIMLIFILAALASMPDLSSSSYFYDQYAAAAASAHKKATKEKWIQIYRIDDDVNPQDIQAVHQAVRE